MDSLARSAAGIHGTETLSWRRPGAGRVGDPAATTSIQRLSARSAAAPSAIPRLTQGSTVNPRGVAANRPLETRNPFEAARSGALGSRSSLEGRIGSRGVGTVGGRIGSYAGEGRVGSRDGTVARAGAPVASRASAPASTAPQPATASAPAGAPAGKLVCDKCDGNHPTNQCPWFKKAREKHKDADPATAKKQLGMSSGPPEILSVGAVRVTRQPGDGSCLFHSLCFGLKDGSTAHVLRRQICSFIEQNPNVEISGDPLKEWVLWDSGSSVSAYSRRMMQSGVWGGGIEMAALSLMKHCNVYVYQRCSAGYKRISSFGESPGAKVVRVLYGGGVHYDALEVTR